MEKEKTDEQKIKKEKTNASKNMPKNEKNTAKEKNPNTNNKQYPATKPRKPKKEVNTLEETKEEAKVEKKPKTKEKKQISASDQYIKETMAKRKKIIKIATALVVVIVIGLILSTGFAFTSMTNSKIISGIKIDNIDVSGMTEEEALKILEPKLEERKNAIVKLQYAEYEKDLPYDELEVTADIEEAVKEALKIGRGKSIFENNLDVIKSKFNKRNIEIKVSYNESNLDKILSETSLTLPGAVQKYSYSVEEEEKELVISNGKDGIILNINKMKEDILGEISDFSKDITSEREILVIDKKAEKINIDEIYKEVHSEPQDAYIVDEPFQVVVDKDGIDFDMSMEEIKEMLQEEKEEYIIPLKITKASVTVADLGEKAFPDRLSIFTTRYNAGNVNRSTNLAVACSKINNYVVQPGETFSYNQVLGKRSVENGFREAHIFTSSGVEDGMGGGICQISTTLYNAVLYANLEIVERHNHAYDPEYVDLGRDATVSYGSLDFKFKNPRKYPIKITAYINAGVATVSIHGIKEENEPVITLSSTTTGVIPFNTQTIEDETLDEGTEVVEQNGLTGGRSVAYKIITYADGTVEKIQLSSDTYAAITKVVRVGTKKVAAKPKPKPSSKPAQPKPTETPSPEPQTPEPEKPTEGGEQGTETEENT